MTKKKPAATIGKFDGVSIIRPVVRGEGVKINQLPYEPRTPAERVLMLPSRTIDTNNGPIVVRQFAVFPSNGNAKSKATQEIGLVECRETGEVFYLWSHITKVGDSFIPKVYDLAPELLLESFEKAHARRESMPAELREALGFVG